MLVLVAQGRANPAIAAKLGLGHKTIQESRIERLDLVAGRRPGTDDRAARDAGLGHKSRIWGTSARSSFRPDRQYFPAHHDSRLMTPGHPPAETFIPTRAEVVRINATIRRVA